ncbi:MAG: hypothetical protein KDE54_30150, partial [Caldilineaceae bacterium]|nr:hypothetical protein [Caldilineaceae bacterium]
NNSTVSAAMWARLSRVDMRISFTYELGLCKSCRKWLGRTQCTLAELDEAIYRVLMVVYRASRKSSNANASGVSDARAASNLARLLSSARNVTTFYLRLVYGNAAALLRMVLTRDQCELRKEALSGARYDRDMVLNHHLLILNVIQ